MKKFALILVGINALTLFYLFSSALTYLPDWQERFKKIKEAVAEFKPATSEQEVRIMLLKSDVETAEASSRILIEAYRSEEMPLLGLTVLNIVGLTILATKPKSIGDRK